MAGQSKPCLSTSPKCHSDPIPTLNAVTDPDSKRVSGTASEPTRISYSSENSSKPAESGSEDDDDMYIVMTGLVQDAAKPTLKADYVNVPGFLPLPDEEGGDVPNQLDQRTTEQNEQGEEADMKTENDEESKGENGMIEMRQGNNKDEEQKENVAETEMKEKQVLAKDEDVEKNDKEESKIEEQVEDSAMGKDQVRKIEIRMEPTHTEIQNGVQHISLDMTETGESYTDDLNAADPEKSSSDLVKDVKLQSERDPMKDSTSAAKIETGKLVFFSDLLHLSTWVISR